jgi:hypothetical protein
MSQQMIQPMFPVTFHSVSLELTFFFMPHFTTNPRPLKRKRTNSIPFSFEPETQPEQIPLPSSPPIQNNLIYIPPFEPLAYPATYLHQAAPPQ